MINHFAKNFKMLRQKAGKTQLQAADDLIVPRPTVGAWEESRSYPKYDQLIAIADYFNITIDQLIR